MYKGMSVIKIAMKPINQTGSKSKVGELMKKNVVKNDVKNITQVKIYRIDLTSECYHSAYWN
jgi:hypothetical protein